jgi:hypothetical protein
MLITDQRRNPPPRNRVGFENTDDPQTPRVPIMPTPNAVILDDVYDEKLIEQEIYSLLDEIYKTIQMDGYNMTMYIFGEG